MELGANHVVGNFRLLNRLGGRLGQVWRAVRVNAQPAVTAGHLRSAEPSVVLKIAVDATQRTMLQRELAVAEAVRRCSPNPPNLVLPTEAYLSARPAFLVLPSWRGGSLRARLSERGPLPPEQAATWWANVLAGLAVLHAVGYAHGDVKPENVLLDGTESIGSAGHAAVADLGLAVAQTRSVSPDPPAPIRAAGTWHYMSPEQREGRPATPNDDVYAASLLLYEMLTGRRLESLSELTHRREVPLWAQSLIRLGTGPQSERPRDAAEMGELLASHYNLGDRPGAPPVPRPVPTTGGSVVSPLESGSSMRLPAIPRLDRSQVAADIGGFQLSERLPGGRFTDPWLAVRVSPSGATTASGATAIVTDAELVVVTFLPDPQFVNNLRHDTRPIEALRHRHVAALLGRNLDARSPHVITEHIPGPTLRSQLSQGRFSLERAKTLLLELLAGLEAIHAAGLAHHNLRPEVVLLSERLGGAVVITELPLGRAIEETTCQMCMSGIDWADFAVHWRYLSPEQEAGETGGPASDVYAAGLMGCEMLLGYLPPSLLRASAVTELPVAFREVLARSLAPAPVRFRNAGEFRAALQNVRV